jgi:hypothetical protein
MHGRDLVRCAVVGAAPASWRIPAWDSVAAYQPLTRGLPARSPTNGDEDNPEEREGHPDQPDRR